MGDEGMYDDLLEDRSPFHVIFFLEHLRDAARRK